MSKKIKDPFYRQEKNKYATPVASREFILQILEEFGRPVRFKQLLEYLNIVKEQQQEALTYRLKAMVRDGQLMLDRKGRFCLLKRINLQRGKIQAHPEGFGFFIPDEAGKDMLISAKEMKTVMHGDTVLAYQTNKDKRGRLEGKIHEVLEHANNTVVGRFFLEHGIGLVIPDNKRLTQDISIPPELSATAKNNQIVLVEIIIFPTKRNQAIGKIIHVLGDPLAPGMETETAIYAHGIPVQWNDAVLAEVAKISQKVSPKDTKGRVDLRHLSFVTIDGEDAKDFDDAVYCYAKPKGGFQLYVAIADVSHYVRPESNLDKEALIRGNSVYFPGRVVPMLPEALSNGICSLNPLVDRLAIVAEMAISAKGKITRSKFYKAVFKSQARFTYTQVAQWLSQTTENSAASLLLPLKTLEQLYFVLLKARKTRGAIDFDTTETKIIFDDNKKISKIVPLIRNDAHRIIEECMLAANVSAAKLLKKANIPTLYRVHAPPEAEKIIALKAFLMEFGLNLSGSKKPQTKDFQKTLNSIGDKPERHLIETVMLRSLKQARYQEKNEGHFGLAYEAYTHFTSPIRRYPDLLVHRAIGEIIENQTPSYSEEKVSQFGKHCSSTERRADEATRDVVAWLKCEYMQDKLGQVFSGSVSGVTGFGIFVMLDDIYVEGLVHITALKNDYYIFDAVKHRLVGERSRYQYRIGDHIKVLVSRVDLDERKIDFEPVDLNNYEE